MAKGQVFSIANAHAVLRNTQANTEKQSFALLNPNDGVVYLAIDRPADNSFSGWDWKLPSQSYGLFPGPWTSLGLYYLDQSGAGIAGELNLYDSDDRLDIPDIHSIGRALQARQNTLDVTQGPQPANPGAGVSRIWVDNIGYGHVLQSSGADDTLLTLGGAQSPTNKTFDASSNVSQRIGKVVAATSTVSLYSFINIPQGFSALRLTGFAASMALVNADTINLRFNGILTSTYTWQELLATGAAVTTALAGPTSSGVFGTITGANNSGVLHGDFEVLIPSYAQTGYQKGWLAHSGGHNVFNTSIRVSNIWGNWESTNAITEIDLVCGSGAFRVNSTFILEGIP